MLFKVVLADLKRERGSVQGAIEQFRKARQQNQGAECEVWCELQR